MKSIGWNPIIPCQSKLDMNLVLNVEDPPLKNVMDLVVLFLSNQKVQFYKPILDFIKKENMLSMLLEPRGCYLISILLET